MRASPAYYCMDGTIPRKRLDEMLRAIEALEGKYALHCHMSFTPVTCSCANLALDRVRGLATTSRQALVDHVLTFEDVLTYALS
jgi:hypothetical protein